MVGIVAVTRFCESGSAAFASYIDYIDRDNATKKDNLEKYNLFDSYLGYMDDETKTVIDDYQGGTEKVSALFTRSADELDREQKKELKRLFCSAQDNGSNMWQTVISFDNQYLEDLGIYESKTNTLNEKLLRQAGRTAINKMLEKEGLDNAVYAASFHYNTDNIHIHIATVEPTPLREKKTYKKWQRDENGKYKTTADGKKIPVLDPKTGAQETYDCYKGTFKQSSIEALKSSLRSELENNREVYSEITSLLRGIINDKKSIDLLKETGFDEKMSSLYAEIKQSGTERRYWNYNQNSLAALKPQIDDLSDLFIKTYHSVDYDDLIAKMAKEAARQTAAYGGNVNAYISKQLHDRQSGLYTRLGNAILKELQNYDQDKMRQIRAVKDAEKFLDKTSIDYSPAAAVSMLENESMQGNTFAQNKLGFLYLAGKDVGQDMAKAKYCFEKSARNGNSLGIKMTENIKSSTFTRYNNHNSVCSRDFRRAIRLLQRSMDLAYSQYRNLQEAELLQREIEARGESI